MYWRFVLGLNDRQTSTAHAVTSCSRFFGSQILVFFLVLCLAFFASYMKPLAVHLLSVTRRDALIFFDKIITRP